MSRSEGRPIVPSERSLRIREHNEHLAASARNHRFEDDVAVPFLCECDDEACRDHVPLTLPEFAERSGALTFTAPEHHVTGPSRPA